MKKYLSIAAVLGVVAFLSVSFLAQADDQGATSGNVMVKEKQAAEPVPAASSDASEGEAAADKADAAAAPSMSDAKFQTDDVICNRIASTPKSNDAPAPTDAEVQTAYKACMTDKGHTEAELQAKAGGDQGADSKGDTHDHEAPAEE